LMLRYTAVLALAASAHAADFYWKHDSEWANPMNWESSTVPLSDEIAAFRVSDRVGRSADKCSTMDAIINIPNRGVQESGGFVMAEGVEILIGDDAAIKLNVASSDAVVGWKCKSSEEVDFRCGANWASNEDRMDVKGGIPCHEDTVWFTDSFNVDNTGTPLVEAVIVMANGRENEFDKTREIMSVHEDYAGFARSFIPAASYSSDRITMTAAALDCFDSCPGKDTATTAAEKYKATHDHLVHRQEFLSEARVAIGDNWIGNDADTITTGQQENIFGRANVYVFAGADDKTGALMQIQADSSDVDAFVSEVMQKGKNHFEQLSTPGGCLADGSRAFSFMPTNCIALEGWGADVDACTGGVADKKRNLYKDSCPSANNHICPSNKHVIVGTRTPLEGAFGRTTCGHFNEDISFWTRLTSDEQESVSEICCEAKENVKVLGCGFTTENMQSSIAVDLFADGLINVAQGLFHGADRGEGRPNEGKCQTSYVATDVTNKYLPINLYNADGEFLQMNDNEDLDADIAVSAIATSEFATALCNWEVSDKEDDFDEKFHVKKFRGVDPERKRRGFNKIRSKIENMMVEGLPFGSSLSFEGIEDGADYPEFGAQIIVEEFRVNWFERESLAMIDHSKLERYLANVFLGYGMETAEYALKVEEYTFLTTSTTTTATTTKTVTTITTTLQAEASGIPEYLTVEKTGWFVCAGAEAKEGKSDCADENKVISLTTKLADLKEVFEVEVAAAKKVQDDIDDKIRYMTEDLATKRATFLSAKSALDQCDKTGFDKLQSISYPDGCMGSKQDYDAAAGDFLTFVGNVINRNRRSTETFVASIQRAEQQRIEAEAAVLTLQFTYQEDLAETLDYNGAIHDNEDSAFYKYPEEIKDMANNFDLVSLEMDAVVEELETFMAEVAKSLKANYNDELAMKAALESQKTSQTAAVTACTETEEDRLSDVPSPVLTEGSDIFKEELELKARTIVATCKPHAADVAVTDALLAWNAVRWNMAKQSDEEAVEKQIELEASIEEYKEDAETVRSALAARSELDDAWPVWLLPVIAGGGGLVFILIIVAAVMSCSGGGGGGGNGGGSQNWGDQSQSVVAFENPVYDEQVGGGGGQYDAPEVEEEGGGLYDEPETLAPAAENDAGGGYLDVEPEASEEPSSEESDEESSDAEESDE